MEPKILGIIQLVGALIAGWFGWQAKRWDTLVLALVFIVMAIHRFMEKR